MTDGGTTPSRIWNGSGQLAYALESSNKPRDKIWVGPARPRKGVPHAKYQFTEHEITRCQLSNRHRWSHCGRQDRQSDPVPRPQDIRNHAYTLCLCATCSRTGDIARPSDRVRSDLWRWNPWQEST